MPLCFVMQPFDGGDFDKRYDEIYKPAIEEAGFDSYRVDRDANAAIPIDSIESGIRTAAACFADITIDNPNVWFELGFALCARKPLCMVCGDQRERFPFDIQHRKIIRYKRGSPSDFKNLHTQITDRLKSILKHDNTLETVVQDVAAQQRGDLDAMEFSALCLVFENEDNEAVSLWSIANEMERAGYTKIATKISVIRLAQRGLVEPNTISNSNGKSYSAYSVTEKGHKYIIDNLDKVKIRRQSRAADSAKNLAELSIDDDIPF